MAGDMRAGEQATLEPWFSGMNGQCFWIANQVAELTCAQVQHFTGSKTFTAFSWGLAEWEEEEHGASFTLPGEWQAWPMLFIKQLPLYTSCCAQIY